MTRHLAKVQALTRVLGLPAHQESQRGCCHNEPDTSTCIANQHVSCIIMPRLPHYPPLLTGLPQARGCEDPYKAGCRLSLLTRPRSCPEHTQHFQGGIRSNRATQPCKNALRPADTSDSFHHVTSGNGVDCRTAPGPTPSPVHGFTLLAVPRGARYRRGHEEARVHYDFPTAQEGLTQGTPLAGRGSPGPRALATGAVHPFMRVTYFLFNDGALET